MEQNGQSIKFLAYKPGGHRAFSISVSNNKLKISQVTLTNVTLGSRRVKIEWAGVAEPDLELKQFSIRVDNKTYKFTAPHDDLMDFKRCLANKVVFKPISLFYQPRKGVAESSTASVYQVRSRFDYKMYAIKCSDKNAEEQEALSLEIQNMRQLDHPQLIHLYEVFEGEQKVYMVIDYLSGRSLHDLIMNTESIDLGTISVLMKQMLEGIQYLHSLNMMHRDLKPENIMFQTEDITTLKIVDFGLATHCNLQHYYYKQCGTPGYLAPEVANYQDVMYGKECDLFSLGAIFYKLLTTRDLFPGSDCAAVFKMNKSCKLNLSLLSLYRVPQNVQDLLNSLLDVNPSTRITANQALQHEFFKESINSQLSRVSFITPPRGESSLRRWYSHQDVLCVRSLENLHSEEDEELGIGKVPQLNVIGGELLGARQQGKLKFNLSSSQIHLPSLQFSSFMVNSRALDSSSFSAFFQKPTMVIGDTQNQLEID